MCNKRIARVSEFMMVRVAAAAVVSLGMSLCLFAQGTETVLYSFTGASDGAYPYTGVAMDSSGNLFAGTSVQGNKLCGDDNAGCGTLLELSPNGAGGWNSKSMIFPGGNSGGFPTGITTDASGNLFISEARRGLHKDGQVVELSPDGSGGWIKSLVHAFNGTDGISPFGVTVDGAGNLYGMTAYSPKGDYGIVFKLSRNGAGQWIDQTLHQFTGGTDGTTSSYATVALDGAGNLYGTTYGGGEIPCEFVVGCGVVFELTPQSGGGMKETILHTFASSPDGAGPSGNLLLDSAGNIYGTALHGGNNDNFGCGIVFELSPQSGGGWTYTNLYTFQDTGDGCGPNGLRWDAAGNIIGASLNSIYKLSPIGGGGWDFATVYSFSGTAGGFNDFGAIVVDSSGNVYGTMLNGGDLSDCKQGGCGLVYEVTP